jgi:hypothetical protein
MRARLSALVVVLVAAGLAGCARRSGGDNRPAHRARPVGLLRGGGRCRAGFGSWVRTPSRCRG